MIKKIVYVVFSMLIWVQLFTGMVFADEILIKWWVDNVMVWGDEFRNNEPTPFVERMKFFLILVPAAISDSINPCAFAVMLLLLSAILSKYKSNSKVFLAWFLFTLAVFISYLAMWIGLYEALATTDITYRLKVTVGWLGVLIWLLNLKDYFWYGKWFVMEVPISWRPKMHYLVSKVTSPWWAFIVWFLISLFLLPCTSWPYITVLWYMASESNTINLWWYIYLIIYNIIFILPMLIITFIVWFGFKTVNELAKLRKANIQNLHLIVWVLMLWLWVYILFDAWFLTL